MLLLLKKYVTSFDSVGNWRVLRNPITRTLVEPIVARKRREWAHEHSFTSANMKACLLQDTRSCSTAPLVHADQLDALSLCWLHNCSSGQTQPKVMLVASRRQRRFTATPLMQQAGRFPSSHMTQSKANYKQCCCLAHRSGCTASPTAFCTEIKEQLCLFFYDKLGLCICRFKKWKGANYILFFVFFFISHWALGLQAGFLYGRAKLGQAWGPEGYRNIQLTFTSGAGALKYSVTLQILVHALTGHCVQKTHSLFTV